MPSEIKNVVASVEGTQLVIMVDLTKDFGPSSTGKSIIIASTSGFMPVAEGVAISLNVTKRRLR